MPSVFISYRREDTSPYAGRLCDRLRARFGKEFVFMDIDTIQPGDDFVDVITNEVGSCDVVIAVIGKGWIAAADERGGRRLDNPNDYVAVEVATALQRRIRVIPVLVGGASMPQVRDLPEVLSSLARKHAVAISDQNFDEGADRLIKAVESAVKPSNSGAKRASLGKVEVEAKAVEFGAGSPMQDHPWVGLRPFHESDRDTFGGRNAEIAELQSLIRAEPLTVLFGPAGIGKTSLLFAGLFPKLRKNHFLPVYVRLDARDQAVQSIEHALFTLQSEIRQLDIKAPEFSADESLWQYLHRSEIHDGEHCSLTPVLVFDQLEEVVTQRSPREPAVAQFRVDLGDLVENRVPASMAGVDLGDPSADWDPSSQRYRVLLSFREEFLPVIEEWRREIPSISRNRMRLRPMSGTQAVRAIRDRAPHLLDESAAIRIVREVSNRDPNAARPSAENLDDLEVGPALLSIVCFQLDRRRMALGRTAIDEEVIGYLSSGSLLSDYYERAVADVSAPTRRFIEDQLVTPSGYRLSYVLSDAITKHGVREEELRGLIDRRLLSIELRLGTQWIQLVHDLLIVDVVRSKKARTNLFRRIFG